jgi:hypothetical protein
VNSTHADLPHRRLPGQKATGFDMDETELLQTLTRVVSTLNDTGIKFAVTRVIPAAAPSTRAVDRRPITMSTSS